MDTSTPINFAKLPGVLTGCHWTRSLWKKVTIGSCSIVCAANGQRIEDRPAFTPLNNNSSDAKHTWYFDNYTQRTTHTQNLMYMCVCTVEPMVMLTNNLTDTSTETTIC